MTELSYVVSSNTLTEEPNAVVQNVCPRELLGFACLVGSGFGCLCQLAEACRLDTSTNESGTAVLVNLTMTGVDEPKSVMKSIELTGYRADLRISHHEVVASFNLRRPENTGLRLLIRESGV